MRRAFAVSSALAVALQVAIVADAPLKPAAPALNVEEALRAFKPRPGFTVELVAAEPLVQSPIAFDWGPDGKLWVVEMIDYPLGLDNKGKPGGRIKCLESTKSDGKYDKATIFLDNLEYPSGVMAWGKGVLVTCAPDIFYAEDTDGDGKADKKEVLFTGFGEVNPQHRVNGLRWGLDNWVYCANGDFAPVRQHIPLSGKPPRGTPFSAEEDVRRLALSGAAVKSIKTGKTYDIRNRDLRIRPDTGELDPQTGQSQFGRDRDDWGNWFGCDHSVPMWHYALDDRYIRRNSYVAAPNPRVNAPPPLTYPVGRVGRDTGTRRSDQGNAFTSSCSIMIYRDDLFGPEFANNWFVSEPVHNLIHREVLVPNGVTFTSRRAADEPKSEFLASADPWFTPTTIRTGPDGAIWVADMYRWVIEHPNWIPKDLVKRVDLRAGADKGRIYRIYPSDKKPRPIPRLDKLDTAGLVAALDSPNGWQRDTAQRLLVQRKDKAAIRLLEKQLRESKRALCRLHALCTLDGLGALKPAILQDALADKHPGVRKYAVLLCEPHLERKSELDAAIVKLATDADWQVRLQVAYALSKWQDDRAHYLALFMYKYAADPFLTAAAISSVTKNNLKAVVRIVFSAPESAPPRAPLVECLLRTATGFANHEVTAAILAEVADVDAIKYRSWQFTVLSDWLDALDQGNTPLPKLVEADTDLKVAVQKLDSVFDAAREKFANPKTPLKEKLLAIRLLGRGLHDQDKDLTILAGLLAPQTPSDLQVAAVNSLGQFRDEKVPGTLLRGWISYSPALRTQVLDVLSRREEWLMAVFEGLEQKKIQPMEIDTPRRQRFLDHKSDKVRKQAAKLFADLISPDRQKVVQSYKSALGLKGDIDRGKQVFTKTCAACHRLAGIGQQVGPDLAMTRDKEPDWFLTAIFDPNQAVDAKYVNYQAVTKNGQIFTGVLSNESGNSITLVSAEGKPQVILRANLEELFSTGKSAMPDGLEKDLKPQDVADVILFLRSAR